MRRRGLLALPALLPSLAHGQSGGMQVVIPYSPGGGHDISAASQRGLTQVARAAPDGRTIGYGLWPRTTALSLHPARLHHCPNNVPISDNGRFGHAPIGRRRSAH